jgi:hypothetical protein
MLVRCSTLALAAALLSPACGGGAAQSAPTGRIVTRESPPNTAATNPVVAYLRGAELQCESSQVPNIRQALDDLVTLPATTLRARRYSDYSGTAGAWDLPRVLRSHFVPNDPRAAGLIDDLDVFWAAADSDDVRVLAREMLRALDEPARASPLLAP